MLIPKKSHEHLQLDIIDRASFSEILSSPDENVSHVVEAAVQELPDLIPCWSDLEQIALNREMVVDVIEPLLSNNSLEHISLL